MKRTTNRKGQADREKNQREALREQRRESERQHDADQSSENSGSKLRQVTQK